MKVATLFPLLGNKWFAETARSVSSLSNLHFRLHERAEVGTDAETEKANRNSVV